MRYRSWPTRNVSRGRRLIDTVSVARAQGYIWTTVISAAISRFVACAAIGNGTTTYDEQKVPSLKHILGFSQQPFQLDAVASV